jgi:streptogramin lyase
VHQCPPTLARITPDGTITNYTDPSVVLPESGTYNLPVSTGPDGQVWAALDGPNPATEITTVDPTSGAVGHMPVPCSQLFPSPFALGPDGRLWAGCGTTLFAVAANDVATAYPTGHNIVGLTSGPDGAMWFTTTDNLIGRITTDGSVSTFSDPSIQGPGGITSGPDGGLWFTNYSDSVRGLGSIGRISVTGVVTSYTEPIGGFVHVIHPKDIALGSDGALWFTIPADSNGNNAAIGRITP